MTNKAKKTELQRLLSKRGAASRKQAGELIKSGVVSVNEKIVKDPLAYVSVSSKLKLNGVEVLELKEEEKLLVAFHKPRGIVTTTSDEKGRKTVYDALPKKFHHLMPVGRLDMASSGLLLFTNDHELADWFLDPKNKVERSYVVVVKGAPSKAALGALESGIKDKDEILKALSVEVRKESAKETTLIINLVEGKNRELRRMCKAIKHDVIKLKRVSFANIELGDLKVGETRIISLPLAVLPRSVS